MIATILGIKYGLIIAALANPLNLKLSFKSNASPKPKTISRLTLPKVQIKELINALGNDNMFWRMMAQNKLVQGKKYDAVPLLVDLAKNKNLDGIGVKIIFAFRTSFHQSIDDHRGDSFLGSWMLIEGKHLFCNLYLSQSFCAASVNYYFD